MKYPLSPSFLYTILVEILLYATGSFFVVILIDSILPGFFSSFFSLLECAIGITSVAVLTAWIGKREHYRFTQKNQRLIMIIGILVATVLIVNSITSFPLFFLATTLLLSAALFYFLVREILSSP